MFTNSFRSIVVLALFAGVVAMPSASQAQGTDSIRVQASPVVTDSNSAAVTAPSGARMVPAGITVSQLSNATVANAAPMRSAGEHVGQDKAMMGVGAVALVLGLVIGGDVGTLMAVGGAGVGLVGLYRYMQ